MKFEIPYQKELSKFQNKLRFDLVWKPNLNKNRLNLVYAIATAVLGSVSLIFSGKYGWVFLGLTAYFLVTFFSYLTYYRKNKKRYFDQVDSYLDNYDQIDGTSTWEFHSDYFRYKDKLVDSKYDWSLIKECRVIEDQMFIDLDSDGVSSFILGKEEVEEGTFEEVVNFVKNKLALTKPMSL